MRIIGIVASIGALAVVVSMMIAPTLTSFAATTTKGRACDDDHSCVVTYKNGSQAVELSNAKWKCMDKILAGVVENTAEHGVTISSNFTAAIANIGLAICLKNG